MIVAIHHQIRDAKLWAQCTQHLMATMEKGQLPAGLKGLMYLPSRDGRQANCLWEADSLSHLQTYLDHETGPAAVNEYFPVDEQNAVGLPAHEGPMTKQALRTEEAMHLAM